LTESIFETVGIDVIIETDKMMLIVETDSIIETDKAILPCMANDKSALFLLVRG
jgi:hypothetical protein